MLVLDGKTKARRDQLAAESSRMKAQLKTTGVALAAREGGVPGTEHAGFRDAKVHIRGEYRRLGQAVKRGAPEILAGPEPIEITSGSGRAELARWISRDDHPLTPRVMANRIWLHHFGEGIVRTPNNFGFKSDPPSHPELLDWLASEAVRGGWKLKRLHKLIMMSSTYRQSSTHPSHDEYAGRDYANRLIWRFNRRRLDAEALRDAILTASGRLNKKMGGPSFFPRMSPEALEGLSRKATAWGSSPPEERSRRSIYMMSKRSRLLPLMTTFDFCDTTLSCGQRDVSLVPTQALALLNNHFVHEQSRAMAERLQAAAKDDLDAQLSTGWHHAFGRAATPEQLSKSREFVHRQTALFKERKDKTPELTALANYCQALMSANKFGYVD